MRNPTRRELAFMAVGGVTALSAIYFESKSHEASNKEAEQRKQDLSSVELIASLCCTPFALAQIQTVLSVHTSLSQEDYTDSLYVIHNPPHVPDAFDSYFLKLSPKEPQYPKQGYGTDIIATKTAKKDNTGIIHITGVSLVCTVDKNGILQTTNSQPKNLLSTPKDMWVMLQKIARNVPPQDNAGWKIKQNDPLQNGLTILQYVQQNIGGTTDLYQVRSDGQIDIKHWFPPYVA